MHDQPLVSVILPTRGRPEALRRSIESLLPASIEVLLAADEDDEATLRSLEDQPIEGSRVFVSERFGYRELHRYVNRLCEEARGDWLFLWNDDAIMETPGWDEVVAGNAGEFVVLNPDSNHGNHALGSCIFPIVPRRWFELLGHFSLSNHNDTWVECVAKELGILRNIPARILHDRVDLTGSNDDDTARERVFTTGEFFGAENQALIRQDAARLREEALGMQEAAR